MKNLILLLICVSFFSVEAKAQSKQLRLGLISNIEKNISSKKIEFEQMYGIGYLADYSKTNYRLGLNLEYNLNKKYVITSGINYSNHDFKGTFYCYFCEFSTPPSPENIELRFIEIPLALKYYFSQNRVRPFGQFGLNNSLRLSNDFTDNAIKYFVDTKNKFYLLGIKVGGGIEYTLDKNMIIQMGLEYNNGISDLYKGTDFKLKSLALGIGVMRKF